MPRTTGFAPVSASPPEESGKVLGGAVRTRLRRLPAYLHKTGFSFPLARHRLRGAFRNSASVLSARFRGNREEPASPARHALASCPSRQRPSKKETGHSIASLQKAFFAEIVLLSPFYLHWSLFFSDYLFFPTVPGLQPASIILFFTNDTFLLSQNCNTKRPPWSQCSPKGAFFRHDINEIKTPFRNGSLSTGNRRLRLQEKAYVSQFCIVDLDLFRDNS